MAEQGRQQQQQQVLDKLQQEVKTRWLKPEQILKILQNHELFMVSDKLPQKPQSGSWFLFNRRVLRYFRSDGLEWQKKEDGKTIMEAHERLKIDNVDALNCYCARGNKNPTFQRRIYSMLDPAYEHIALVHYRDVLEEVSSQTCASESDWIQHMAALRKLKMQLSLEDKEYCDVNAEEVPANNEPIILPRIPNVELDTYRNQDGIFDVLDFSEDHINGTGTRPCLSAIDVLKTSDTWSEEDQLEAILHPACMTPENQWFKIHEVSPESAFSSESTRGGVCIETVHEDPSYMEIDMELNKLERIVNESEEPDELDLSLLHSITEKFSEKKKIGSGGCGIVYKGILQNGVVAVKRLHSSRTIKDKMFHREVISLISVKHQNIVRFLGYCSFTKELAIPYEGRTIMADIRERLLCFEYIRNGSLDKHLSDELRGLEWQTRHQIIIGICRGLHYLHKDKAIIHMDLKPGNILLDDLMVPKITDFGLSRSISDSHATTTLLISQGYAAPEYISRGKATSKSDIYSLGIIIIELVTGSRMKPNITKVLRRWNHRWIKSMNQSPLGYQQVAKCLELALRCIQDDPTDRPDISYIIDELNEIDTKDGQTQIQINPCCLEDILGIEPLEIHIPFEDLKISHSIELNNNTDDYIAFFTKAKLEFFCTEPKRGIVPPRSKCIVTLAVEARINAQPNEHYTEVITVVSNRVDDEALAAMGIVRVGDDMSIDSEEGKVVDEVNVMVVFGRPQLPEE